MSDDYQTKSPSLGEKIGAVERIDNALLNSLHYLQRTKAENDFGLPGSIRRDLDKCLTKLHRLHLEADRVLGGLHYDELCNLYGRDNLPEFGINDSRLFTTKEEAIKFFDKQKAKGFSVSLIEIICSDNEKPSYRVDTAAGV